jgi:hypothetical protein
LALENERQHVDETENFNNQCGKQEIEGRRYNVWDLFNPSLLLAAVATNDATMAYNAIDAPS